MKSSRLLTRSRIGFTLVELLVVVAIISLLAAILFPVFATAREKARQTSCASNMKQIGIANTMYAQDYDEEFCMAFRMLSPNKAGVAVSWDGMLRPYIPQTVLWGKPSLTFVCPDDTFTRAPSATPRSYAMASAGVGDPWGYGWFLANNPAALDANSTKYGFAGPIMSDSSGQVFCHGRNLSELPDPSGTFAFIEVPEYNNVMDNQNVTVMTRPVSSASCTGSNTATNIMSSNSVCGQDAQVKAWHNGGWNYTFVDGHVKWLRPEQTIGASSKMTDANVKGMWSIAAGD